MDYEKKYKEALGWMQSVYPTMTGSVKEDAEHYFPELRESEDESTRKRIIALVNAHGQGRFKESMLAWLEKQCNDKEYTFKAIPRLLEMIEPTNRAKAYCQKLIDSLEQEGYVMDAKIVGESLKQMNGEDVPMATMDEQKSINKVKPKFHEGAWITNGNYTWKIVEVKSLDYMLQSQDGNIVDDTISHVDEQFHSFTIQDAKDGDVLACESGWTCIFKTLVNDENFSSYCFMDNTKWFCETGSECHTLKEEFVKAYNGKIYPATKEQCDTLMKAMADAGYAFDFENKELKKIEDEEYNGEDYGIDGLWHAQRILEKTLGKVDGYQTDDGILDHKCAITAIKKLYEQKPAEWSEEDEKNLRRAIRATKVVYPETADWLKSLKDRVQPQNNIVTDKELAQAKKDAYNDALDKIEYHSGEPTFDDGWNAAIWYLKKRNDRPQSHWTPSDAQIQALKEACDKSWEPDGLDPLYTLYKDLKKLKGE